MDPLSGLLFYSPLQLGFMLPLATAEFYKVDLASVHGMIVPLMFNGFLAVGLNLAMLFFLHGISSTTHATLGSLRDVIVVGAAAVLLKDCPHPRQAFGRGLALGGVYLYNQLKAAAAPPPAKS